MITYEYRCTDCGHIFPLKFRFTENPSEASCPECQGAASRFFGSVPPVHYKGSGWAGKRELDAMDPRNDNPTDFSDLTGV